MKKSDLVKAIRKIHETSDLETMDRKNVRWQIEAAFGMSLDEYESFINDEITKVIKQEEDDLGDDADEDDSGDEEDEDDSGDNEEEDDAPPPSKKAKKTADTKVKAELKKPEDRTAPGGLAVEMLLSPELSEVLGITQSSRPQLVKKMWEYIREQGLQDPNDKRTIILNDALKNVFQRDSFTMFTMNKYLKRHVVKPDDHSAGEWADIDSESSEEVEEKTAANKLTRKT